MGIAFINVIQAGSGSASQSIDGASTSGASSTGTYTKKKHVSKVSES